MPAAASGAMAAVASSPAPRRFHSLDALRGCIVAAMLLVNDPGDWQHVWSPLEHATWHGCTPTDLVFPGFLFVMGASVALGLLPRRQAGIAAGLLMRTALWRALRIIALGLAINLLAAWLLPGAHARLPGVLQRIGVCFAAVAGFALYARPWQWWGAIAVCLLGYAGLLCAGGSLEPGLNLVDRVDSALFGAYLYQPGLVAGVGHDPEGLLACLPSIASGLLGLVAGDCLRHGRRRGLAVLAVAALLLGWLWSLQLPFNKNLWTPSFALWCAGWSSLALLAFHEAVDRRGWPAWGRRLGINALAAYAGSELLQILLPALGLQRPIYRWGFASWLVPLAGPYLASLAYALAFVLLWWGIAWWLDRRRIYLKL